MTKIPASHREGRYRKLLATCAVSGLVPFLGLNSAKAEAVDTELLLLVDVSGSVNNSEFNSLRQELANSFRSSDILNSIQSGQEGSLAVSLVFWGGNNRQRTAIDWVNITDSVSAEAFATSLENVPRPFRGATAIGDALRETVTNFGTETGGNSNGFESSVQVVNIIGDGRDNATPPGRDRSGAVADARDLLLASGVDVINGIAINDNDPTLADYYDNFVVGGAVGSQQGSAIPVAGYNNLGVTFTPLLASTLTQAAVTTVPEPASGILLLSSCGLLFFRRR